MRHRSYSYVRNLCTGFRSRSSSSPSTSFLSEHHEDFTLSSLKLQKPSTSDDLSKVVFKHISSIFYGGQSVKRPDSEEVDDAKEFENMPNVSWLSNISQSNVSLRRKECSREKKQKLMFEFTQESRFGRLVAVCARMLGTETTVKLFGKVGRELGVKGYNTLIETCIDKARGTDDEDIAIEEMGNVFHLFKSMSEQGLQMEEQTYRPLLLYIVNRCMVEEFHFFCNAIKGNNPSSITRLGYYEMMLWLRVNNEEKIRDLCNYIAENDGEDTSDLGESYLLALCQSERKKEILELLETIDVKKLSSAESVTKIFQALGRLMLEPVAEKFLWDFKTSDHEADYITDFIANYAVSIPDLSVEDVITKFKDLHQKLEVSPSSSSYEKLILHSCALCKEHTHSDGELDRLLLLLEELNDTDYWNYACCRIILYCIWNRHTSSAVHLCKLLKDKLQNDELVMEVLFDKVFSLIEESESKHLHTSLELLSEIKDKLGLLPSQRCHDSRLSARANANDLHNAE